MHPLLIPSRSAARIVTIHDLYFLDRPEHTAAEIRRDYPALAGDHAGRADAVVVNSNYTARQVAERLGVASDRITVCYPGRPSWSQTAAILPAPGPILFLGTTEPRKNVARLIEAYTALMQRRPDAPDLVIAGAAPASTGSLFSQRRIDGAVRSRVRFTGYVSDAERQRLLSDASVLALPSLDEGFGITALEAMTVGRPRCRVESRRAAGGGRRCGPSGGSRGCARALDRARTRIVGRRARRSMSEQGTGAIQPVHVVRERGTSLRRLSRGASPAEPAVTRRRSESESMRGSSLAK